MTDLNYTKLIDLFATNTVKAIDADGNLLKSRLGVKDAAELSTISAYVENIELIRPCKIELESIVNANPNSTKDQVRACLLSLKVSTNKKTRALDRIRVFVDLLKASIYRNQWTEEDRKTFDWKYEAICEWKHYFLSYTNRGVPPTNHTFGRVIRESLITEFRTPDLWEKKNLLAPVVVGMLRQIEAYGFFDEKNIEAGDVIEDKIKEYCPRCWSFIQIVEREMFATPDAGKKNWCFEEYGMFDKARTEMDKKLGFATERYYFVIAVEGASGDAVKDKAVPTYANEDYSAWIGHLTARKGVGLPNRKLEPLRAAVQDVGEKLLGIREKAIANLL